MIKHTKISTIMTFEFNCKKINIYEKWVPLTAAKMVHVGPKKGGSVNITTPGLKPDMFFTWKTNINTSKALRSKENEHCTPECTVWYRQ